MKAMKLTCSLHRRNEIARRERELKGFALLIKEHFEEDRLSRCLLSRSPLFVPQFSDLVH
jgi:hypothetical protein